jgi:hypothetical protein
MTLAVQSFVYVNTNPIKLLSGRAAVVAHDAGAANVIVSWLMAESQVEVSVFMQGPAELIWRRAFPGRRLFSSIGGVLEGSNTLISGTGWSSDLEHNSRVAARSIGVRNVAVIDHWVNYTSRFERNGVVQLPDEVWVCDADARVLAEHALPGVPVRQWANLYLAEQLRSLGPPPGSGTLLVILEPTRDTWGRSICGEFQALDYLFEHLEWLMPAGAVEVLLRPHPSESADKYQRWLTFDPRVLIDTSPDVSSAISRADVVVGLESVALTIALAAGRPVFSSLPPWAPPLRLPQSGIREIRHMVQL